MPSIALNNEELRALEEKRAADKPPAPEKVMRTVDVSNEELAFIENLRSTKEKVDAAEDVQAAAVN